MNNKLSILISRLKKINIEIECFGNLPWIYLNSVNGNKVKEKYLANHGFTIMFSGSDEFTDLKEIFKVIKKYR